MFRTVFAFAVAALVAAVIATPTHSSDGGWISMGPNRKIPADKKPHKHSESTNRQYVGASETAATVARQSDCTDTNQCSYIERFGYNNKKRWFIADGYANGEPFDSWWSKRRVYFDTAKTKVKISVARKPGHKKPYASGHLLSRKWHGYGCYEVRMRPANQEGLITTFFSFTGRYDHAPGHSKAQNEIDIEFVYKSRFKRIVLQANFFTNGRGGNEHIIRTSFNPARKMHNYGFKWTSRGIEWYVDGKKVYTATRNTPKIRRGPHKIMMNLWPVTASASGWAGNYAWRGSKGAAYSAMRFTRGEDCVIQNRFG